jgi:thiosulfate/3-mercaptopyruvate sulfurtransferase
MLLYLGATTVFLLDGGWPAWVALGGAVETDSVPHARGTFEVAYQSRRRRSLRDLQAELTREPSPVLVDTRFASEVTRERHPYLAREGVLPRALQLPFDALFDPDGRFVDKERYRHTAPATLLQAREVVAYCEVGVRACTFALLHETYTGEVVAVFDGSHNQWSLDSNPLRRPETVRACYSSPALTADERDESAEERSSSDAP